MTSKRRSGTYTFIGDRSKKNTVQQSTLTFKEVLNKEDLIKCFQLRYRQYNNPDYRYFLNENIHYLDLDGYDLYSRHWAVYSENNEILGYARIIQKEMNNSVSKSIHEIINQFNLSIPQLSNPEFYLPIHKYQSNISQSFVSRFLRAHEDKNMVELSRFMIPKGSPLRTSKFMVNAGLGIYHYALKVDSIVLACNDTHEKFWSLYGFKNMRADQTYHIGTLKSVNLYSSFEDIHPTLSNRLRKYADLYELKNEISIEL